MRIISDVSYVLNTKNTKTNQFRLEKTSEKLVYGLDEVSMPIHNGHMPNKYVHTIVKSCLQVMLDPHISELASKMDTF